MQRSFSWLQAAVVIAGGLTVLAALFVLPETVKIWTTVAGVALTQFGLLIAPRSTDSAATDDSSDIASQRQSLEAWYEGQAKQLQEETERLNGRQRELTDRFAQLQEFLEYPVSDPNVHASAAKTIRLSEQDREVHQLLEREAERVYEKIRANGYSKNDSVDLDMIRGEVIDLVQRVARVYSPDSHNPLLETSFEQLARSASRVCLHSLVLLEQLPLDVKSQNINDLYGYVRKAVVGYGAYQQVAPWLKHLSRGAYAGRFAAGASPITLGAWWLATEIGRRGAAKMVENVVDRQAVAALNDIVAIVGVEVANVYGPGFRQRDAAWVYGSELTELLQRFPISRESLQHGLREVTSLPLRSEYDRVYLYRCIASHRSSGLRLADAAVLTRQEREQIAHQLEQFFATSIHGVTAEDQASWQEDVEARLDLKLKLTNTVISETNAASASAALSSVHAFLTSICRVSADASAMFLESSSMLHRVPLDERANLLESLPTAENAHFTPPDLDPGSDLAEEFLNALMTGAVMTGACDENVEPLLLETACYFRRSRDEAQGLLDEVLRRDLKSRCGQDVSLKHVPSETLRCLRSALPDGQVLFATYNDVGVVGSGEVEEIASGVLAVTGSERPEAAFLVDASQRLWVFDETVQVERVKGYFLDDCELRGGHWSGGDRTFEKIVLTGSLTSGGYSRMFKPLLELRAHS